MGLKCPNHIIYMSGWGARPSRGCRRGQDLVILLFADFKAFANRGVGLAHHTPETF